MTDKHACQPERDSMLSWLEQMGKRRRRGSREEPSMLEVPSSTRAVPVIIIAFCVLVGSGPALRSFPLPFPVNCWPLRDLHKTYASSD